MQAVLSVFDKKAELYSGLYLARNLQVGIRMFADAVRAGESLMRSHPEDFVLIQLGAFDEELGQLVPQLPLKLLEASDVEVNSGAIL